MPAVSILVDSSNNVTVNPPVIVTNPNVGLTVTFTLTNNGSLTPKSPFIRFPWPVPGGVPNPSGCSSWSQYTGNVSAGPGAKQNQATMPSLSSGQTQCYKYNIEFTTLTIDPEVENQGPPPGYEDPGPPEDTPGKGPKPR